MAQPSNATLPIIDNTVSTVGTDLLNPSVNLRPTAHPTSRRPAKERMIQDMEPSLSVPNDA